MNPELIDPAATPDQVLDAKLCLELLSPAYREVLLNRFFYKKTLETCAKPHEAHNALRMIHCALRRIRARIERELKENNLPPIDVYRPIVWPPRPPKPKYFFNWQVFADQEGARYQSFPPQNCW